MDRRDLFRVPLALPWAQIPASAPSHPASASSAAPRLEADLLAEFARVRAIDTHEHILPEAERVARPVDMFTLASHYALDDVTSAGLSDADRTVIEDVAADPRDKWRRFAPFWAAARETGYGRALRIALHDVYDVDTLDESSVLAANERISAANRTGLYRDVLLRRANLRVCLNDEYWQPRPTAVDPACFALVRKFDWFVAPVTRAGVGRLEPLAGHSITSVADLKRAMAAHVEAAMKLGLVAIKTTLAYQRSLAFVEVSEADAQRTFDRLMRDETPPGEGYRVTEARPYTPLADHLFHHLVQLAEAHGVPMQVHTGLHAGNGNFVTHSRPADLTNLFFRYPRVTFDLFHVGYPYHHEAMVLAKTFRNVCLDFCWMHIVSPLLAQRTLDEALDLIPSNKIFAFGGDYRYPELSYAHLVMARRNIATALAARVGRGDLQPDAALAIGRAVLHDNPARVFSRLPPDTRA
ncbi:MAG TPA: amidohydrolase family protein [Luteitalea sp.]|nr:amidohydrolase family protein [Luteitalea sp.]